MLPVQWVPGEVTLILSGEEFKALSCALVFKLSTLSWCKCAVGARGGDADLQRRGVQGAVVIAPAARGGPGGVLHLVPPLQGLPEVLRGARDCSCGVDAVTAVNRRDIAHARASHLIPPTVIVLLSRS